MVGEQQGAVETILNAEYLADHAIIGMNRELHVTKKMLAPMSHLQRMTELTIHSARFDAGAFEALRPPSSLKLLTITNANIDDDDLQTLARHTQLESLELSSCHEITDAGLLRLTALTNLTNLTIEWCDNVEGTFENKIAGSLPACTIEFHLADVQKRNMR